MSIFRACTAARTISAHLCSQPTQDSGPSSIPLRFLIHTRAIFSDLATNASRTNPIARPSGKLAQNIFLPHIRRLDAVRAVGHARLDAHNFWNSEDTPTKTYAASPSSPRCHAHKSPYSLRTLPRPPSAAPDLSLHRTCLSFGLMRIGVDRVE